MSSRESGDQAAPGDNVTGPSRPPAIQKIFSGGGWEWGQMPFYLHTFCWFPECWSFNSTILLVFPLIWGRGQSEPFSRWHIASLPLSLSYLTHLQSLLADGYRQLVMHQWITDMDSGALVGHAYETAMVILPA